MQIAMWSIIIISFKSTREVGRGYLGEKCEFILFSSNELLILPFAFEKPLPI
jgi:hypothetical protein